MTAQQAARQIGQAFKIDQQAHMDETVQNLLLAPILGLSRLAPRAGERRRIVRADEPPDGQVPL